MDLVPDTTILERADILFIEALLLKARLRWAGHVSRMSDTRPPKIALYGELQTGWRIRGAPKKRYKDFSATNVDVAKEQQLSDCNCLLFVYQFMYFCFSSSYLQHLFSLAKYRHIQRVIQTRQENSIFLKGDRKWGSGVRRWQQELVDQMST